MLKIWNSVKYQSYFFAFFCHAPDAWTLRHFLVKLTTVSQAVVLYLQFQNKKFSQTFFWHFWKQSRCDLPVVMSSHVKRFFTMNFEIHTMKPSEMWLQLISLLISVSTTTSSSFRKWVKIILLWNLFNSGMVWKTGELKL